MTKISKIIGAAALGAALLGSAEANDRAVPRGAAGSAYSRHPRPGGFFRASIIHSNARFHFFGGRWGYVYGNFFYDPFCGPVPWSIGEIRYAQAMNWYRPDYTIGEVREIERWNASGYSDGFARRQEQPQPIIINNYITVQAPTAPAEAPVETSKETKADKPKHEFPYSGKIAKNQLDDAGAYLLRDYFRATGSEYLVYTEPSKTGIDDIEIRDRDQKTLLTIRPSEFNGQTGPEYVGFINSFMITKLNRDLYEGLDIGYTNYSAGQNR